MLDTFDEIHLGVGYELDGERLERFPARTEDLERVRPVYETLPGWKAPTVDCRTWDELPGRARAYLDRVREVSGVPIRYVSVGSSRSQIVPVGIA